MRPSDAQRAPLVIITDAHISRPQGNSDAFFEMLATLEQGAGDVVFLGDIFDLWIALTRYEDDLHHRFLSWCQRQKPRRRVGFVEGNHEFFLAREHADAFTWCTQQAWWQDVEGNLFCHGDRINRFDRPYLTFRQLIKNPIARALICGLPLGPRLVHHVKERMKSTNQAFRKFLPQEQLRQFAAKPLSGGHGADISGAFPSVLPLSGGPGEGPLYPAGLAFRGLDQRAAPGPRRAAAGRLAGSPA